MLKNLCKAVLLGVIAVMDCSAGEAYPKWLSDVPKSKEIVYGVGLVKLTGTNDSELKKLAYYRALDEIAIASESKVEGLLNTYSEETGDGENTIKKEQNSMASKIIAYGIGDSGKIENEYTTAEGDYFILVSSPVKKIKMDKKKPIMIKNFIKETRESKNQVTLFSENDMIYTYASKRDSKADYEMFRDSNATASAKAQSRLPEWTQILNPHMEGAIFGFGTGERYKNESLFLSLQVAIANARVELANLIKMEVTNSIKAFPEKEKVSSEMVRRNVNQIGTSQILYNSEIYKIHISDSAVYVLVGVNDNGVPKMLKDAIGASMKNENAAWETFKQQKALENSK